MAKFDQEDFRSEKLPTLFQYRKEGKLKAKMYTVHKVWFPGKIPVLTLETDCFRFNVKAKSTQCDSILEDIETCVNQERAYFLSVTNVEELSLETMMKTQEQCDWRPLGDYGYIAESFRKTPVAKKTQQKQGDQNN